MPVFVGKLGLDARGLRFFKRAAIAVLICLAGGEFIFSTSFAARLPFEALLIYPPRCQAKVDALTAGPPAAIATLAACRRLTAPEFEGQFGDETLDALSPEQIRYGAYLDRKPGLPILVSSGLPAPGEVRLASLMADTPSVDYGIRAKWLESPSDNTAENAIYSAELLKRSGVSRVILVTHSWQ